MAVCQESTKNLPNVPHTAMSGLKKNDPNKIHSTNHSMNH